MNKPTIGNNTFCGPTAISIVAGITTDKAAQLISLYRCETGSSMSKTKITSVYTSEIIAVLNGLGIRTNQVNCAKNSSLFGLLCSLHEPALYLIMLPYHFVCIEIGTDGKRYICDNHTKTPLSASSSARLGQSIESCYKVAR